MVGWYPEAVPLESWDHVHVEVEDLLLRFSICQEEVDSFASQPRLADGICHARGDLEKIHAHFFLHTC